MPQSYYSQQPFFQLAGSNNNNTFNYQQQPSFVGGGEGDSKTTVFLPDGGYYIDASSNSSSAAVMLTQPSTSSAQQSLFSSPNTATRAPIQYPGHHRDKLDLIRDSLKPFEQLRNDEDGFLDYGGGSNEDEDVNCDNGGNASGEPPEEIQRMMIHALTQVGYDKESAYYALKLVNFNSVMDAAKVLSSIKQNLQTTHEEQQMLQQQQQQILLTNYNILPSSSINYNGYSSNFPIINGNESTCTETAGSSSNHAAVSLSTTTSAAAATISANGRAALSRYGVMTADDELLRATGAVAASTTTTTINLENDGKSVFRSKFCINPTAPQPQQHKKSYLSVVNSMPLVTNTSTNMLQQRQLMPVTAASSISTQNSSNNVLNSAPKLENNSLNIVYDNGESSRSSASPGDNSSGSGGGGVAVVSTALRTPSPQQQQQKRKPRIAQMKTYQCSYTQPPHTVLRHSSSFDPADQLAVNLPSSSKRYLNNPQQQLPHKQLHGEQQQQKSVIRIERNASERIQSYAASSKYSGQQEQFSSNLKTTPIEFNAAQPISATEDEKLLETQRRAIAQLNLSSIPALAGGELAEKSKSHATTTFSPLHPTNSTKNAGKLSPQLKEHRTDRNENAQPKHQQFGVKTNAKDATEFLAETPNIRTIYVDPDATVTSPPNYSNYLNQQNYEQPQQQQNSPNSIKHQVNSQPQPQQASQQQQRCVSPLPESVAKRLRTRTYESCVRPCKAAMFRFFMEQHIEKLIQQHRERNQRAIQLTKEMELAKLAETMQEQMIRLLRQKESKYIRLRRQKMNKNMFDMIRHIGVGAFGKVTLVRKKDTGQIYAMKTLSKEDVIQKQQAAHVKAERDILAEANSNWIVKLFFSFQDARNLYFIMEYVPGGDMMQLLINKGIFSERLARFYIAELTCAIEYVHSLGFIHRDIKPDNILIDQKGHIKLTDFGLCTGLRWTHDKRHYVIYDDDVPSLVGQHFREDSFTLPPHLANAKGKVKLLEHRHHQKRNQAHSVVGTGNYMAPEVIKKTGHTQLCDWWSVGVILYEMVYGRPPFMSHNENPCETQYMIVNWRRFLDLDNMMGARLSRQCVDVIASLCCDQEMRLGRAGAKEIKAHPWFKTIAFGELRSQPAEYVPTVAHAEDTSNFDTFEVNAEELFMTLNRGTNRNGAKANGAAATTTAAVAQQPYNPAFFDFTFRHFFASEGAHGPENSALGRVQPPQQRPSLAPLIEAAVAQQQQQKQQQEQKKQQLQQKQQDSGTIVNSKPAALNGIYGNNKNGELRFGAKIQRKEAQSPVNGSKQLNAYRNTNTPENGCGEKSRYRETVGNDNTTRISVSPPPPQKELSYFSITANAQSANVATTIATSNSWINKNNNNLLSKKTLAPEAKPFSNNNNDYSNDEYDYDHDDAHDYNANRKQYEANALQQRHKLNAYGNYDNYESVIIDNSDSEK